MDEPTNDIDIPTLEVLEESLMEFPGSLVLVTHDRYMLDRVSTSVLGLDGSGGWGLFADYSQWEQARAQKERQQTASRPADEKKESAPPPAPKKKLSYIEARDYETIESRIHEAETELAAAQAEMHDPAVTSDPVRLQAAYAKMQSAQESVDKLYERWAELESKLA
jgi:ATP-binding cassette subfamily F protein uup